MSDDRSGQKASNDNDSTPGFFQRMFGRTRKPDQVSEEEIKLLVTGNDELLEDEKRMIGEILELGYLKVDDVMTPRVDVIAAEDHETVRAAVERMRGTGYSRLPVYHESLDSIVGIVHLKDLLQPLLDGETGNPVGEYAHAPLFVPASKDLFPLLSEMQTNRQQMAIVVDEYGGTDGLITVEDIVEEIVGEIDDESDLERTYVKQTGEDEWEVDGRFPVEDALEMGWPVEESDEYDTMAGWFMDVVDMVPQIGREIIREGYSFQVTRMRRRRISELKVKKFDDVPKANE